MHISKFEVLEPLKEILPTLAGRPVYVTIDIDVLDPAHAPGTGTVDAGGITSKELLASIHEIARSEVNVVGADLVEVAPIYDPYCHSDHILRRFEAFDRFILQGLFHEVHPDLLRIILIVGEVDFLAGI